MCTQQIESPTTEETPWPDSTSDLSKFDLRDSNDPEVRAARSSSCPSSSCPKFELPKFDLPKFDVPSSRTSTCPPPSRSTGCARDAAYVGVGLAVMTVERVQELQQQLVEPVKEPVASEVRAAA